MTGAIDGKHIRIQNPALCGSQYFNYKSYFSTVLLAVADATYRFVYIDVGSYGKEHDASVFTQSTFGNELQAGLLNIPEAQEGELPYVFVADEAFQLKRNIWRPFPARNFDTVIKTFNLRLSRARRVVESTFGIMVSKWRVLRQPIIAEQAKFH